MYEKLTHIGRKLIPRRLFVWGQPLYHYGLALLGAFLYRNPSKQIFVIGITGTKGKTTTTELVSAILEEAGYRTAIASTLRFKVGLQTERNLYKMTMPGRFAIQRFLREAVKAHCDYAIIEITSEGAKQFRHKFIHLNSLIFTNITPEHIESHGSYEAYVAAKLSIAEQLRVSEKQNKTLIVNIDSAECDKFLATPDVQKITYTLKDTKPFTLTHTTSDINIDGERMVAKIPGEFNVYNILAAATFVKTLNITTKTIKRAVEKFTGVPGRMEQPVLRDAENTIRPYPFTVIVDYAHTADSLEKVYTVFKDTRKICVLGSCGGGRDRWKRPLMGKVASDHCDSIILTNEDPYDEDPRAIVDEVAKGIEKQNWKVVMDRREAIRTALMEARELTWPSGSLASSPESEARLPNARPHDVVVFITGKGTDPYIMGPNGTKQEWNDLGVATEELEQLLSAGL